MPQDICNIDIIYNAFKKSKCGENIELESYLIAYRELNRLFDILGPIFKFVSKDLNTKLDILTDYHCKDTINYMNFESMMYFEKDNIIQMKSKSGSRNLLRLHRALRFIYEFIGGVRDLPKDESLSTIAGNTYTNTLANYHSFLLRKGVQMALYTLPTKSALMSRFTSDTSIHRGQDMEQQLSTLYDICKEVYACTQNMFQKRGWLELP